MGMHPRPVQVPNRKGQGGWSLDRRGGRLRRGNQLRGPQGHGLPRLRRDPPRAVPPRPSLLRALRVPLPLRPFCAHEGRLESSPFNRENSLQGTRSNRETSEVLGSPLRQSPSGVKNPRPHSRKGQKEERTITHMYAPRNTPVSLGENTAGKHMWFRVRCVRQNSARCVASPYRNQNRVDPVTIAQTTTHTYTRNPRRLSHHSEPLKFW